jgi:hypothetical protein
MTDERFVVSYLLNYQPIAICLSKNGQRSSVNGQRFEKYKVISPIQNSAYAQAEQLPVEYGK